MVWRPLWQGRKDPQSPSCGASLTDRPAEGRPPADRRVNGPVLARDRQACVGLARTALNTTVKNASFSLIISVYRFIVRAFLSGKSSGAMYS